MNYEKNNFKKHHNFLYDLLSEIYLALYPPIEGPLWMFDSGNKWKINVYTMQNQINVKILYILYVPTIHKKVDM